MEAPLITANFESFKPFPNQLRWSPFDIPTAPGVTFVSGLTTICGTGSASSRNGIAVHIYAANTSMGDTAFYNADGDFLIGTGPPRHRARASARPGCAHAHAPFPLHIVPSASRP